MSYLQYQYIRHKTSDEDSQIIREHFLNKSVGNMEQLEGKNQSLEVKRLSELPLYKRLSILRWIAHSKSIGIYEGGKGFVCDP